MFGDQGPRAWRGTIKATGHFLRYINLKKTRGVHYVFLKNFQEVGEAFKDGENLRGKIYKYNVKKQVQIEKKVRKTKEKGRK